MFNFQFNLEPNFRVVHRPHVHVASSTYAGIVHNWYCSEVCGVPLVHLIKSVKLLWISVCAAASARRSGLWIKFNYLDNP